MPDSCGSYWRMNDDNSNLARSCNNWGREGGIYYVGKWGHESVSGWNTGKPENRLFDNPAFEGYRYHWLLCGDGWGRWNRWECDDFRVGVSSGDFWKVFVR